MQKNLQNLLTNTKMRVIMGFVLNHYQLLVSKKGGANNGGSKKETFAGATG